MVESEFRAQAPVVSAGTKAGGTGAGRTKAGGTKAGGTGAGSTRTGSTKAGILPREKMRQNEPAKSRSRSEARATARAELSGAIRRGSSARFAIDRGSADGGRAVEKQQTAVEPVPAKVFSGRLLALAVVLIAITVMLAPSVRVYLQQRSEISALQADIVAQQEQREDLRDQLSRWEDPSYIKQQARDRLFLVMPGEKRYLVKGADGYEQAPQETAGGAPEDLAWVDALWDSVKRSSADQ